MALKRFIFSDFLRAGLFAALLATLSGPVAASEYLEGTERCTIGDKRANLKALCRTVTVPVDPETPAGDTLDVSLAIIPARDRSVADDPLLFISGGPGQSALESYPAVAHAFRHVNRSRDIVLVDQRGTGSSGLLDCPTPSEALQWDDDVGALVRDAEQSAAECLASLDVDTRLYTTSVAVQDLERVREALGIDRWSIYGVSYGTRVAMHYARRFPEATRAMVLDAVVPPGVPLGPDIAAHAQRALSLILSRCENDPGCAAAFPDIESRTAAFITELEATPIELEWEDIARGTLETSRFTRASLAASLRLLSYSAHGASLIPSLLHDAIDDGHLAPLARQADLQTRTLEDSLATGMHYAVVCSEDLPFMDIEQASENARGTYLGDVPLLALAAACGVWPEGRVDADFHEPLGLSVPTLMLSGEADPVTPPDNVEQLLAASEQARHIVNAGQGHMQMPLGCMPQVVAQFIETLDTDKVIHPCLDRLRAPPFFIDANGPQP